MKEPSQPSVTARRSAAYSQNVVLGAGGIIIVILLSFYVGTLYQKSHALPSRQTGERMRSGPANHFRQRLGGLGTVKSVSSGSITIDQLINNGTKTYTINSDTKVRNNGQAAAVSDIKTGDRVLVRTSGSGSTTAAQIVLNPSRGGSQPSGTSTSST